MEKFKLYSVSDDCVEWLRKEFPNVYSNKINSRTHTLCSNVISKEFGLSDRRDI